MMHDFNSVSGMWSEMQLKGRGGRRGGEGTNVEGIKREREEEGAGGKTGGEWGRFAFLHTARCPRVFGWVRASSEGKEVEGGGEGWSKGEGPVWLLSASHVSKLVLKNE